MDYELLPSTFQRKVLGQDKGVAKGGSWGARDPPPFVSLFVSKQPTIFR